MKEIFVFCLIFFCCSSFGQEYDSLFGKEFENTIVSNQFTYKNSIEFEFFGHGFLYSFDYERLLFNSDRFKTLGQIGIAYYPKSTGIIPLWIPIMINQLYSFNKHHIEIGLGQIIFNDQTPEGFNDYKLFGGFKIGYRFQKPKSRFLLKAAFMPIIDYWDKIEQKNNTIELHPSGGLTLGFNF